MIKPEVMKANQLQQDPLLFSKQFTYHHKEHIRANDCGYFGCHGADSASPQEKKDG